MWVTKGALGGEGGHGTDPKRGFTFAELLVGVGITCLVIALLIPAAQSARESARRAHCQNNLRQLGLAIHAYEASTGRLPPNLTMGDTAYPGHFAMHVRLLPFIEQQSLFNSINFRIGIWPIESNAMIHLIQGLTWNPHNATLIHAHVGTFICPSDGGPLSETGNNYRASLGVGPNLLTSLYHPDSANGMFPLKASVPLAAIVDGLSHTSAMSERIRGSGTGRGSSATTLTPGRDSYQSIGGFLYDADDWRMTCEVSALQGGVYGGYGFAGKRWYIASSHLTLYDHVLVPNDAIPDCAGSAQGVGDAVATARSAHPGGVNVLFGDGSIRFVASTVQVNVWRAFGSRKGGELVD